MSVPQISSWNAYKIEVWEDGRLRKALSTPGWGGVSNYYGAQQFVDHLPAILVLGKELPDTHELAMLLPVQEYNRYRGVPAVDPNNPTKLRLPSAFALPAGDLPPRWIDYSGLDVVCASLDELARLKKANPAAFAAILDWTASGGNLWVYGAGPDPGWNGLAELENLAGLEADAADGADPTRRGWKKPNRAKFGKPLMTARGEEYPGNVVYAGPAVYDPAYPGGPIYAGSEEVLVEDLIEVSPGGKTVLFKETGKKPQTGKLPTPFLLHEYELGLIVAIATDNPFPNSVEEPAAKAQDWAWLLNSMGTDRWLWYKRHGMSTHEVNADYWNFLIPDVGLAPVGAFCILITLFVLAIGPLNYWLLRRWRRLHLLVVTIPLGAAAVTLGLFAYAILADGLGTRVRVRSVTRLDQGRGRAVCWSRLSYYAGLAPRGGLRFPADVAVLPLENVPAGYYNDHGRRRTLFWESDQQLRRGWLASRTPTQYLTVRSRESSRGLDLTASADGTFQITNRLGSPIRQLLVYSTEGDGYWAEEVGADATAALKPVTVQAAWPRLTKTHRANHPSEPPGFEGDSYGPFGIGYRRRMIMARGSMYGDPDSPSQHTSRMERALATLGAPAGAASLEPGSYVAIVEQSPEAVLGTPSAREEASYHVVFGKW